MEKEVTTASRSSRQQPSPTRHGAAGQEGGEGEATREEARNDRGTPKLSQELWRKGQVLGVGAFKAVLEQGNNAEALGKVKAV
eukprot:7273375-Pyramimonas_sp.AAC.1